MFDIVPLPPVVPWSPSTPSSFRQLTWINAQSSASNEGPPYHEVPKSPPDENLSDCPTPNAANTVHARKRAAFEQTPISESVQSTSAPQNTRSSGPRPRKGHKKSRHGCYNCKRRKIKCPENLPSCHNCVKIKLPCEYPSDQKARFQGVYVAQDPIPCLQSSSSLQPTPTVFKASDLRLFHHFLFNAYPHLPLGNEDIWVKDIASFAHAYDFLLQAILGLSASHISMTTASDLNHTALSYRILAIRSLNAALSRCPESAAESDAILATCYALAFQTSYLGHSIEEFLTMFRGCFLVLNQQWRKTFGTVFMRLGDKAQVEFIEDRLGQIPLVETDMIEEARESFKKIRHLCEDTVVQEVHKYMFETVELLSISSREAYFKNRDLHLYFAVLPHTDFQHFISPSNTTGQILLAHFVALHCVMAPIKAAEWSGRKMGLPNRRTVFFIKPLANNVPSELKEYLDWPLRATGGVPGVPSCVERSFKSGWILRGAEGLGGHVEGPDHSKSER